jgi:hypothetical protein
MLLTCGTGLTGDNFIGPCALLSKLTGPGTCNFSAHLPQLLEHFSSRMWQHVVFAWRCTSTFQSAVQVWLGRHYPRRGSVVVLRLLWHGLHGHQTLIQYTFASGVPWKMRFTPTLLTPENNFGDAYRMQQMSFVPHLSAYWSSWDHHQCLLQYFTCG